MTKNLLNRHTLHAAVFAFTATIMLSACKKDKEKNDDTNPIVPVELKDYSVNPSLLKTMPGFESLKITTLISSDDVLPESPNFIFGAQPDGAGIIKDPAGNGFIMINNHEILQSVSRVYLDKNFKPVKGEYIVDSDGGMTRLCSATMATPEEHGFAKPVFLTAGESGAESMIHAIDPLAPADKKNNQRTLQALGRWSAENAVPLPKGSFPGKSVILIGEDESDGQLAMYVSAQGDLNNGKLYVMKRDNNDPVETNMVKGRSYNVEFVELDNVKTSTGAQLQQQTIDKKALMLARVEDIDYRKGSAANGREVYFTATGVSQADKITPVTGKTMWGRVYKLVLDANDPLRGKLEVAVDGNDSPGSSIVNPDNLCVTENYVYIQEDGDSFYKNNNHDGTIWQFAMGNKTLKAMLQMDHRRNDAAFSAKYNPAKNLQLSTWEYGAMYDVSDLTGIPGTFAVNLHPHTWTDNKYRNADGGTTRLTNNSEGGQVVIVRGIAR
ncbi:alkaline phosphatase PhoX [Pedobacter faecalis]|uniref:alkaline phosphatase PhoX n=1 Tax=Pedobacter faecalis TaxID=3041495 RepID=UPI00254DEAA9|nr:alkaline phosphatase PhoX [Pedobacter sp. ELA7]